MRLLTLKKVNAILSKNGIAHHYLRYKAIKDWDKYDISNFKSILSDLKKISCKICGSRLTAKDSWMNEYKICLKCLDNSKLASLKEQAKKRGKMGR